MPFEKGRSGNPKGRPRQTAEQKSQKEQFKRLLKSSTVEALQSIIQIANDRYNKDRFNACKYMLYSPCVWAYTELEWKENTFTFYQFQKVSAGLLNMLNRGKYTDGYCAYEEKVYGDKAEYVRKRVVLSILVFLKHLNELHVLEQSVEYYINWLETNGFEWINPRNHDKTLHMHSFFDTYLPEEILSLKGKRLGYLYANISLFEEYYKTEYSNAEMVQLTINDIKTSKVLRRKLLDVCAWKYQD